MKRGLMAVVAVILFLGWAVTAPAEVWGDLSMPPWPKLTPSRVTFTAFISNNDMFNPSNALRYELWAMASPSYLGGPLSGYKVWQQLSGGGAPLPPHGNRDESPIGDFAPPPDGTYYFVLVLTEYQAAPFDDGFVEVSYYRFANPITYPVPVTITPQAGLWWNPAESGTGYAIDVQHGVVVVTIYSYRPDGNPQWYLMAGPLNNNTVTGVLQRYRAGQCISCAYRLPTADGDDGIMNITFTSPTTALMTLPGGRSFTIKTPSF